MDIERRLSWELSAGKISMAEENYETAIIRFTNVKSIAHAYGGVGLQSYIDMAVMLAVKASTMNHRAKKEFRFKVVVFVLVFIFLQFSRFIFGYIKEYLLSKKLKEKFPDINE
jgi:hypothetical protein